jgi:uncharacterized protein (TIGR02271 family)
LSDATKRNDKTERAGDPGAGGTAGSAHEDAKLHLLEEELSVRKETRETGRVRVATQTHEREALVDEDLASERVEIERVPVGRCVEAVPDVRQDGDTTVVPVVEEVLHVERRLMLTEEVRIRRVRTTERHQEKVSLRRQEAVVTRLQPDASGAAESSQRSQASTERKE